MKRIPGKVVGFLLLAWALMRSSSTKATTAPAPRPTDPSPAPAPRAVWPVPGAKLPTAPNLQYGAKRSPTHTHQGVDIVAPEGTPVLAPIAGVVVHVNRKQAQGFRGYGKTVVLRAELDGRLVWMLFAHLSKVAVNVNDLVAAGTKLGTVGRTEYSKGDPTGLMDSGAHLHLEASLTKYPKDGEAPRIDPTPYLRQLEPK